MWSCWSTRLQECTRRDRSDGNLREKFEGNFGTYELGSCRRINCSFDIGIETIMQRFIIC